jgi:hypothetical protein
LIGAGGRHLTTQEKPIQLGFATIDPLEQGFDGKF